MYCGCCPAPLMDFTIFIFSRPTATGTTSFIGPKTYNVISVRIDAVWISSRADHAPFPKHEMTRSQITMMNRFFSIARHKGGLFTMMACLLCLGSTVPGISTAANTKTLPFKVEKTDHGV